MFLHHCRNNYICSSTIDILSIVVLTLFHRWYFVTFRATYWSILLLSHLYMFLHHRHLVVYCGLNIVSPLVFCYLPCNILINIVTEPFIYVPPPSASCCLLWSEHCFTVGILLPSVQHKYNNQYCWFIWLCSSTIGILLSIVVWALFHRWYYVTFRATY